MGGQLGFGFEHEVALCARVGPVLLVRGEMVLDVARVMGVVTTSLYGACVHYGNRTTLDHGGGF